MDKEELTHTKEQIAFLKTELGQLLKARIPVRRIAQDISKSLVYDDIDDVETYLTAKKSQKLNWGQLQQLDDRIETITNILV
jgi:hypothetical protein